MSRFALTWAVSLLKSGVSIAAVWDTTVQLLWGELNSFVIDAILLVLHSLCLVALSQLYCSKSPRGRTACPVYASPSPPQPICAQWLKLVVSCQFPRMMALVSSLSYAWVTPTFPVLPATKVAEYRLSSQNERQLHGSTAVADVVQIFWKLKRWQHLKEFPFSLPLAECTILLGLHYSLWWSARVKRLKPKEHSGTAIAWQCSSSHCTCNV